MIRCPKCDEELEVQEADPDVGNLRAKLDIAISALEFARDGYERIDIKHIEYRVGVYTTACDALDKIALPSISNHQPHAVSQGWQPIETAPKDERILLGGFYASGNFDVEVGAWVFTHRRWPYIGDKFPTHWMPLPAPPSPAKTDPAPSSVEER